MTTDDQQETAVSLMERYPIIAGTGAQRTRYQEIPHYAEGLYDLGQGVYAWMVPNGSWGESNAGLITGDGESLLVNTIVNVLSFMPRIHQPSHPQQTQVMADRRLTLAESLPEVPHTQLFAAAKHLQDPQTRLIGQDSEQLSQIPNHGPGATLLRFFGVVARHSIGDSADHVDTRSHRWSKE